MTLCAMTLSMMTLSMMTLSMMTLSMMTLGMMSLSMMTCIIMAENCNAECNFDEWYICHYVINISKLTVVMLSL